MFPRLAPTISLLAALAPAMVPAMAHAQVNIDQGKPPAQIFANDCAACHKATRGLAKGKNSLTLTAFLREHYTTSREQAAALAAYVLGGGGGAPAAQAPGQKPGQDRAKVEEPKTGEPKTGAHPTRPTTKPEEEAPATAKLQPPAGEEAKPEEQPSPGSEPETTTPEQRPAVGGRDVRPATATRGRKKEPEAVPPAQEPAAVAATPASGEPSNQDRRSTASAAAPADSQPGEGAPVPRDNIPD